MSAAYTPVHLVQGVHLLDVYSRSDEFLKSEPKKRSGNEWVESLEAPSNYLGDESSRWAAVRGASETARRIRTIMRVKV